MEEFLNKRKSRLVAVSLLIILSVVVIFAGSPALQSIPGAGDPDGGKSAFNHGGNRRK